MTTVVKYVGADRRDHIGGQEIDENAEIVFDQARASAHGWDNPDDFALYFVDVWTNQGDTPILEIASVDGKPYAPAPPASSADETAGSGSMDTASDESGAGGTSRRSSTRTSASTGGK